MVGAVVTGGAVSPQLQDALRSRRDAMNVAFRRARARSARLDGGRLLERTAAWLDPVAIAVAREQPAAAADSIHALWMLILEIDSRGLAELAPGIDTYFREVLPAAARFVAADPRSAGAAGVNALIRLAKIPGARAHDWLRLQRATAALARTPADWLDAGVVAAWRCGAASLRAPALRAARKLDDSAAFAALDVADPAGVAKDDAVSRWEMDAFLDWNAIKSGAPGAPRVAATAGGFVGFGGPFADPPVVSTDGSDWYAADRTHAFRVFADAYGTQAVRVDRASAPPPKASPDVYHSSGVVKCGGGELRRPEFARASSVACAGSAVALTVPNSHLVYFVAAGGTT